MLLTVCSWYFCLARWKHINFMSGLMKQSMGGMGKKIGCELQLFLLFGEWCSLHTSCHVTSKLLFWSFFCNLIDIFDH
jgi:hypothetical protein